MSRLSSFLPNKQELIHFSKDTKLFPHPITCAKCLNRTETGRKGKSKMFKCPRSKFVHLHTLHQYDKNNYPTLIDELINLEQLSIANQLGILIK